MKRMRLRTMMLAAMACAALCGCESPGETAEDQMTAAAIRAYRVDNLCHHPGLSGNDRFYRTCAVAAARRGRDWPSWGSNDH